MALKRISDGYDAAEKAAIERAYSEAHFPGPSPTLAEACEVIEALLGKGWRGHLSSWDDSVDRARGFLERVKGRHG